MSHPSTGGPAASVIIVSYNTRTMTLRCLATLREALRDPAAVEVIVVDNASSDGSPDAIAEYFPEVTLVRLTANVGWGRGVNRGAAISKGEYLLFVNPDTVPVGDVVTDLVTFARAHPGHGLYTGRTLTVDGIDDGFSCWGLPTVWSYVCFATGLSTVLRRRRWANPEGLPDYDRRSVRQVPAISGCLMLIERRLFHDLGGFDPQFFLYSEDIDLCARAGRLGARPLVCPGVAIMHLGGGSSSAVGQRVKILQGKMTYLRRHWSSLPAGLGAALLYAGVGLRALASAAWGTGRSVDWVSIWRQRRVWLAGWPPVDEPRPR